LKRKIRKSFVDRRPQAVKRSSAGRMWVFRILAMTVVPLFFLGSIEITLRLFGYGYQTNVFKPLQIGDKVFLVNNDDFSLRFFPREIARVPGPIRMEAQKEPGSYRIFILGESAAMGDPDPSFSASRYLEALLSARFPRTHFEIINLGITAINSNVILPIARDCAAQKGDLWIIYMGNNEMVGPFGAATVFGAKAPPATLIRLDLAIQTTRLGQLLANLSRRLRAGRNEPVSWGGMEMFVGNKLDANDPRKGAVYHNFSENLDDIVEAGLGSGAKIVLNTVAVNLKDCAPFASMTNSNQPATDLVRFNQLFADGIRLQESADFSGAIQDFQQAATMDANLAELQFRWGKCLFSLTNFGEAEKHFQLACDDDALPFRADSKINSIIRSESQKINSTNLIFLDAAAALAADVPGNVPGQETFYEHVHFNFDGNYRLARAWAGKIEEVLPPAILQDAGTNAWASQDVCDRRLGLSDWNRSLVLETVIQRMEDLPLNGQPGNAGRLRDLNSRINRLKSGMTAAAAAQSVRDFEDALAQWPDDYYLRGNFALFLKSTGDVAGAAREWQRICELIPQDSFAFLQLARMLEPQGRLPEAESWLRRAVELHPATPELWVELGKVLAAQNEAQSALDAFQRAQQLRPQDREVIFLIGKTLSKLNRHSDAIRNYRLAIQLGPSDWEPHYELGGELDAAGQEGEALSEFAEAAKLNPNYSRAHFNYGVVLAKLGHLDDARQEFERSLQLEPGYPNALAGLAKLSQLEGAHGN
jgi:tetratricopeptide (TPR) repeat protein